MRRLKNTILLGSLLVPALLAAGCGYALVGRGSNIPEDVQMVYLAPLENTTTRAQVEQILGQAIADEVVLRGRFDLATGEQEADAVLDGTITGFLVTPVRFDEEGLAEEYEISISATMEFRRTPSGEVLWRNPNYIFRENYVLTEEEASFFDREVQAIQSVSTLFAKTLLTDLMEGF